MKKLNVLLIAILFLITVTTTASAGTIIMDNDALPGSGTTNPTLGQDFGSQNMWYIKSDTCYNGDAERGVSSEGCQYCWEHNIPVTGRGTLQVYLWHSTFTDPNADYFVWKLTNWPEFGTLNQDKADAGWNVVGSASVTSGVRDFGVRGTLWASTYLGADAIKYTY